MNRWAYQCQHKSAAASLVAGGSDGVVCPRPRRITGSLVLPDHPIRPASRLLHLNSNQQPEAASDAKAGTELLDIIRMKGSYGSERSNFHVASSPPFFTGSPPNRATNPVIQDEHFGSDSCSPLSSMFEPTSPSTCRNGGCIRSNFGPEPAPVRIEGFNCRGNCSVSATA